MTMPFVRSLPAILTAGVLLSLSGRSLAQTQVTVLEGALVYPVAGTPIESGIVVLQAGKILDLGAAGLTIPEGAEIIDCRGMVITPGLIDAGTTLGVEARNANEQAEEITPQMRILDAIDVGHKSFLRALRSGVTTVHVSPGDRNVIGGLGAVVKTHGATLEEMLVKDAVALSITLGREPAAGNADIRSGSPRTIYYRRPMTRMGTNWMLREAFYAAQDYREQKTLDPDNPPSPDPGLEVLCEVLDGRLAVHTTARSQEDIRAALEFAREFGYETVIQGGTELWRMIDEVAAARAQVVFSSPSLNGRGNPDGAEGRYHTLNLMAERGIPFAIETESALGDRSLAHEGMVAMRNGLSFDKTLAAVTIAPARVLGIADRVGSLEKGKDADLVVWTTMPFDPAARAARVFVNGNLVHGE